MRASTIIPIALSTCLLACGGDDAAEGQGEGSETQGEGGSSDSDSDSDSEGESGPLPTTGGEEDPGPSGIFIAVGDGGRRASSSDALGWEEIIGSGVIDTRAEMGEEDILRAVAVGDGVAIAVGGGGVDWTGNAMIMRTSNGVDWEEDLVTGVEGVDIRKLSAITYADGVFVAGGTQAHLIRSEDGGSSWTRATTDNPGSTTVFGLAGHGGTFVAVGLHKDAYDAPEVAYVQRSTDAGLSFGAPEYFGEDGDWLGSIASNGERFVAVGPKVCLRSSDGASWEDCGVTASDFDAVSFTNGVFVLTYLDGLRTSEDGEDWSAHFESPTGVPAKVVYGNGVYAGLRFYDRGTSEALVEWAFVTHGGFPLRDLAFLPLD